VILPEMFLQCVVVKVVMRFPGVSPVADETSLVSVSAVLIELVIVVEPLPTEPAEGVALEPSGRSCLVLITMPHMLPQLLLGVHLVFVRENLLVPRAQVAHFHVVNGANMPMQVSPAQPGEVAVQARAVVSEQENRVPNNILTRILDPDVDVCGGEVCIRILLKALRLVIVEDDERGKGLDREDVLVRDA
jgi:hypothetical protein